MASPSRRIVRIFAKGNVDVRDSPALVEGGRCRAVERHQRAVAGRRIPRVLAKIRHETCTRLDLIPLPGETPLEPPAEVAARLPAKSHPIARQHHTAMFDEPARCSGAVAAVGDHQCLGAPPSRRLAVAARRDRDLGRGAAGVAGTGNASTRASRISTSSSSGLRLLIPAIEERTGAQVLIYKPQFTHNPVNARIAGSGRRIPSPCVCSASTCVWRNFPPSWGFSIVDADRVVASAGADRLKVDLFHLKAEGWRLLAEEVVRILEERGCLDAVPT